MILVDKWKTEARRGWESSGLQNSNNANANLFVDPSLGFEI